MFNRAAFGALALVAAVSALPLAARASDGGMGGGGVPNATRTRSSTPASMLWAPGNTAQPNRTSNTSWR